MSDRRKLTDALKNASTVKPPKGFRELTGDDLVKFKDLGSGMGLLRSERETWMAKRDLAITKLEVLGPQIASLQQAITANNAELGIKDPGKDIALVGDKVFVREPKAVPKGSNGKG